MKLSVTLYGGRRTYLCPSAPWIDREPGCDEGGLDVSVEWIDGAGSPVSLEMTRAEAEALARGLLQVIQAADESAGPSSADLIPQDLGGEAGGA